MEDLDSDPTDDIESYEAERMNVCDEKYTGVLTVDEVIRQFEYRKLTHETYIDLTKKSPSWEIYGTEEFHLWAINGYDEGIRHLKAKYPWWIKLLLATLRRGDA